MCGGERGGDVIDRLSLLEKFPDRGGGPVHAVVDARVEIDRDDLVAEVLGDNIGFIDPIVGMPSHAGAPKKVGRDESQAK
jgi:hypothetical protein